MKVFHEALSLIKRRLFSELVKYIKKYPCLLFHRDESGFTIWHYGLKYGYDAYKNDYLFNVKHLETLKKSGCNFNMKSRFGESSLFIAIKGGANESVRHFLITCNVQMSIFEQARITIEKEENAIDMITSLVEAHPHLIFEHDLEGYTLLHYATYSFQEKVVEYLLSKGADCNALTYMNASVLGLSQGRTYRDKLLDAGAKLTMEETFGEIIEKEDLITIKEFLKGKEYLIHTGHPILGPWLGVVASKNKLWACDYLLKNGVYIDAEDNCGETALHKAYSREITELFLRNKADVNAKSKKGYTALHCAICKDGENIMLLLEAGADINARTNEGETPLDLINEMKFLGYKKMAMEFKKRGAVSGQTM
ncbi:MAG: Ankyrin repeats (3 copies) [Smithella sp. PtaU1.Bin162]|nr:MAG: Ankyrin repeats (3 copies) [Smithella sp. PtaU1.Bin162]